MIKFFYARILRRRLKITRAWKAVIAGPDPDIVSRITARMAKETVPVSGFFRVLAGVPHALDPALERTIRQVLLSFLYTHLQPAILLGIAGHREPLDVPSRWRAYVVREGIAPPRLRSNFRFWWLSLVVWARGVYLFLKRLKLAGRRRLRPADAGGYAVALDVPAGLVPRADATAASALVPWMGARQPGLPLWITADSERPLPPGIVATPCPLPAFPDAAAYFRFVMLSIRAIAACGLALGLGRPSFALLLPDLIQLAHARAVGRRLLARRYIAENSRWFWRPLFTEWAAQGGGPEAVLAFYSTNCELLQLEDTRAPVTVIPGYEIMSWDRYWVWDAAQADVLASWGHDPARIEIVGPVPLSDSEAPLPDLPGVTIAVFDVTPYRPSWLASVGLVSAYYTDTIVSRFILDLQKVAESCDVTLAFKQKRKSNQRLPPQYTAALAQLRRNPRVRIIDADIAASRLIQACDLTVSIPLSSPSVIAASSGKPAAFFDTTGRLKLRERQKHAVPLLMGRSALEAWIRAQLTVKANTESPRLH